MNETIVYHVECPMCTMSMTVERPDIEDPFSYLEEKGWSGLDWAELDLDWTKLDGDVEGSTMLMLGQCPACTARDSDG